MEKLAVTRSERFRTPLAGERSIGMWVDRIGFGENIEYAPRSLRLLGLYAVVAIEDGEGIFISPTTGKRSVSSRDVMLLFPDEPNSYTPSGKWLAKWIVWGGPEADRYRKTGLFSPARPVLEKGFDLVNQAYSALTKLMDQESLQAVFKRKLIIQEMLYELYSLDQVSVQNNSTTGGLIEKAVSFINQSLDLPVSVEMVAKYCGVSSPHFRRLFKAHTGGSPKEFIINQKITKAKNYLRNGVPVKQIADQLGYQDEFYFRKVFKAVTGKTPGEFHSR